MSIRKVLLVLIIVLSSSCSSITGQIEDNPVEIYRAFEESLRGTDIQLPMSFFHEEAVFTSDTGYALEHTELTTFEGIKTEVQEWMDDPNLKDSVILDIYSEGDTAFFRIEFNSIDGWSGALDGYAVIKEGKIFQLHYDPLELYSTANESTQIEKGSFEFDGQEREHLVFIPDNYTDAKSYPLVIFLHGYGGNGQGGMEYSQFNQVGNTYNFLIVYPSGIPNWNSGIGDNPTSSTPDVNDVGYIDALIDTLSDSFNIDLGRIYATGFSNGGFMAYKLACQLSHRIAAVASVSGVMSTSTLDKCNPSRAIPVLHIHGTKDNMVFIDGLKEWRSVEETVRYWTNFNNCDISEMTVLQDSDPTDDCTVEKYSYTNCTNNSNVTYYKVINGGHTWPGAYPIIYQNTNKDMDASIEIWNFFKDYQLSQTSVEN